MDSRWRLIASLMAILLCAWLVCRFVPGPGKRPAGPNLKPAEPPKPAKATPPAHPHKLPFELKDGKASLGNPQAKVKVTVYIPASEGCGNETAVFLYRIVKANSSRMGLSVIDFKSETGGKQQKSAGLSCAGMAINGSQSIKVKDATGAEKTIDLHSNLGDSYKEADVYLALDRYFREAYGADCKRPPPEAPKASSTASKAAAGAKPSATGGKAG